MRQIVIQPNGKYCVFSTVVDTVILYNATKEEVLQFFIEKNTEDINEIIEKLKEGKKPYYQFTRSFEQILTKSRQIHGKKEMNKIEKICKSQEFNSFLSF